MINTRIYQATINEENTFDELYNLLSEIDGDYVGMNDDEDYLTAEGISHFEYDIKRAQNEKTLEGKIKYILECCESFSSNYYDSFKYSIHEIKENEYVVAITTVCM